MKLIKRLGWQLRYGWFKRLASHWRRFVVQLTHLHCTVRFEGPVQIGPGFRLDMPAGGTFIVGPNVEFRRNFVCELGRGDARVTIGQDTAFTYDTVIQCSTSLDIGADAMIGRAMIVDGFHRIEDPHVPVGEQGFDHAPLTIGDGTLITTNSIVMASLGRRTVVGANSVVTSPVPDYTVVVGAPARPLRRHAPEGHPADLVSAPGT